MFFPLILACTLIKVVSSVEAANILNPTGPFTWPGQYSASGFQDPNMCPPIGSVSDEEFLKHCNIPYGSVMEQGTNWYHEFPDPNGGDMKFYDACYHGACNYKDPTIPKNREQMTQDQRGKLTQAMLACLSGRNKCLQLMTKAPIGENVGFPTTEKRLEVVNQHLTECNNYWAAADKNILAYLKKDDPAKAKMAQRKEGINQWIKANWVNYLNGMSQQEKEQFDALPDAKAKNTAKISIASANIGWGACSECEAVDMIIQAQAGTPPKGCYSQEIQYLQGSHQYVMELLTNLMAKQKTEEETFVAEEQDAVSMSTLKTEAFFVLGCFLLALLFAHQYRRKGDSLEEEYTLLEA